VKILTTLALLAIVGYGALAAASLTRSPSGGDPAPKVRFLLTMPAGMGFSQDPKPMLPS